VVPHSVHCVDNATSRSRFAGKTLTYEVMRDVSVRAIISDERL
jgi:hypothetical protein